MVVASHTHNLETAGVDELGRLMRAGMVSPLEVLDVFLDRIERYDGQVRSFLTVAAENARIAAIRASVAVADRFGAAVAGGVFAIRHPRHRRLARTAAGGRAGGVRFFKSLRLITMPFPLAGIPAIVVPSGFSKSGLPLSLQIAGRPFDEATVFRCADAHQRVTGWHRRTPALN